MNLESKVKNSVARKPSGASVSANVNVAKRAKDQSPEVAAMVDEHNAGTVDASSENALLRDLLGTQEAYAALVKPIIEAVRQMRDGGRILGLGADEIPIIAHLGETITPAGRSVGSNGQRLINITVVQNIQTPDVGNFGASQGQIAADAYRQVSSLWNRNS